MSEEQLFDITVMGDDLDVIIVSDDYDSDFAFALFQEFVSNEDALETIMDPENQEAIFTQAYSYLLSLVPEDLVDDGFSVTRAIFTDEKLVITVDLSSAIQDYLDNNYEDENDVAAALFDEEEGESVEEEPEEDEGGDPDWEV